MQRSSPSIAALAGALARAQRELVNPEKSLIGTIKADSGRGSRGGKGAQRLFRYASLAEGLHIVRKTLGQHEIEMVQTTAIDQAAGMVNLNTVLAHRANGSPRIGETAEPHRMGAAPTYAPAGARR
jgi:hypothetical protein